MSQRLALPARRNHITQKVKVAGQRTLWFWGNLRRVMRDPNQKVWAGMTWQKPPLPTYTLDWRSRG
jgi:hypothetical protein